MSNEIPNQKAGDLYIDQDGDLFLLVAVEGDEKPRALWLNRIGWDFKVTRHSYDQWGNGPKFVGNLDSVIESLSIQLMEDYDKLPSPAP